MIGVVRWEGIILSILGLCEVVLASFTNLEESLPVIQAFKFDLDQIFTPSVWVRCYGVPLSTWSKEVFEEIGGCLGRVVKVAKEMEDRSSLEYDSAPAGG